MINCKVAEAQGAEYRTSGSSGNKPSAQLGAAAMDTDGYGFSANYGDAGASSTSDERGFSSSYFAAMAGKLQTLKTDKIDFIIDSGASHHIINDDSFLKVVLDCGLQFKFRRKKGGVHILAVKEGTVRIFSNAGVPGLLEGVLYCPDAPINLLSVKRFQMAGFETTFHVGGSISI